MTSKEQIDNFYLIFFHSASCDFGISGELSNSIVTTHVGCQPYMAPERVQHKPNDKHRQSAINANGEIYRQDTTLGYGITSDVWSLGITLNEVIRGEYPYGKAVKSNAFSLIAAIVNQDAPKVFPAEKYSKYLNDFIDSCLQKEVGSRATYENLSRHPFYPMRERMDYQIEKGINSWWDEGLIANYFETVFKVIDKKKEDEMNQMQD